MDKELFKNALSSILNYTKEANDKIEKIKEENFKLEGLCKSYRLGRVSDIVLGKYDVQAIEDTYKTLIAAYEYLEKINFNFNNDSIVDKSNKFRVISYRKGYAVEIYNADQHFSYDKGMNSYTNGYKGFDTFEDACDFLFLKVVDDIIDNNGTSKIIDESFRDIERFIKLN